MLKMTKYQTMRVPLGGGWKDYWIDGKFRDAFEAAYHQAMDESCRYVHICRRRKRLDIYWVCGHMVGYNGRVWFSRRNPMSEVSWQGEIPTGDDVVEVTGKYDPPLVYSI